MGMGAWPGLGRRAWFAIVAVVVLAGILVWVGRRGSRMPVVPAAPIPFDPPAFSGDPVAEEQRVASAIRRAPSDADLFSRLGAAYRAQKRWEAAEGAFQKVVKLRPKDPRGYLDLGGVYLEMSLRQPAKAASARWILMDAQRIAPDDPEVNFRLAVACERTGQREEALAALERVLRRDPAHAKALEMKARLAK